MNAQLAERTKDGCCIKMTEKVTKWFKSYIQDPVYSNVTGPLPNPAMGGPNPGMGGLNPAMGSPFPPMGGPSQAMGGPNPSVGSPNPAMGGLNPSMGGPNTVMGGPNPAIGGPNPVFGGPMGDTNPNQAFMDQVMTTIDLIVLEMVRLPASISWTDIKTSIQAFILCTNLTKSERHFFYVWRQNLKL